MSEVDDEYQIRSSLDDSKIILTKKDEMTEEYENENKKKNKKSKKSKKKKSKNIFKKTILY